MSRSQELRKKAKRWQLIGVLAFLVGIFMLYQKVYYVSRDFYSDNFQVYNEGMSDIRFSEAEADVLDQAMKNMQLEAYWEATSLLEELKQLNPSATQISEWYKILCMIGLEEKESALDLLEYYTEQPDFKFNKEQAIRLLEEY